MRRSIFARFDGNVIVPDEPLELEREGIPREKLERVHAPIGIEIGALTPEEIAVSIVAEMIAVRRHAPLPSSKTLGRLAAESSSLKVSS